MASTSQKEKADAPQSFKRRDFLLGVEEEVQKKWAEARIFEADAPETWDPETRNKAFFTFPYPYMNGRLHLGHAFSLTKAEFSAGYNRMKGKHVLFPFAFHCTGMPIKACADKLKREVETYGNPPVFEKEEETAAAAPVEAAKPADGKTDPTKFRATKGKAAAKKTNQPQWMIMKGMGVPESEIAEFRNELHWLQYFPPLGHEDLNRFGLHVDWRRSFITTDVNPYYDSFIRWQFETLKANGKLNFGKRYTIYSALDGQPCADHDRASGEGVQPQEYTIIKMRVMEPFPEKLKPLEGKNVFLAPATLRPETMYGQTNCWVLPDGEYGAFEINDTDVFIMTERAAKNLAYQNNSKVPEQVSCLLRLTGQDLIGLPLKAPNATTYERVYALPMLNVSTMKGTGVVTSVPSDSPDDYAALMDLKNKAPLRQKYGVADEWVLPFEVVPIIDIPEYGSTAAVKVYHDLKIKSQNDRDKLEEAKNLVYLKGFYEGVLTVGAYAGKKVADVKAAIREEMLTRGDAIIYSEPEKQVVSRSGDECIVALTDQWYLKYGEEDWKAAVAAHLPTMECYNPTAKQAFENTISWLKEWACSRSYGLGTRLPWDKQYVVDSLSDSTIYMAYYTIAHFLQGNLEGTTAGSLGIKPEQLNAAVWDYVFLQKPYPEGCTIPEESLRKLRNEFEYWYPMDMRCSGKDLIQNHLTMCLYNHAAIWGPEKMPRSMFTNGHIMVDGEKMSKSLGNFLTMKQTIETYSADAARLALADSGDGLDDANFEQKNANSAILRFTTLVDWTKEMLENLDKLRTGPMESFPDRVFEAKMNLAITETDKHFQKMVFREAVRTGFFDLQTARDAYRAECGANGMHRDLVLRFIEVQALLLAPITPHLSEYTWSLLNKEGFIVAAKWPVAGPVNYGLLAAHDHLNDCIYTWRKKIEKDMQPKKGKKVEEAPKKPNKGMIILGTSFAEWQTKTLQVMKSLYNEVSKQFDPLMIKRLAEVEELKPQIKKVMEFAGATKVEVEKRGVEAMESRLPFDEKAVFEENATIIASSLGLQSISIHLDNDPAVASRNATPQPGKPSAYFYFEEL